MNNFFLVIILILLSNRLNASDTLNLTEAIKQKKVSVAICGIDPIKGAKDPVYYGISLKAKLKNLTSKALVVLIEVGQIFKSNNSKEVQDMVLTKTENFNLPAEKEVTKKVYAMCANMPKDAPNADITYIPNGKCDEKLLSVVKVIEKNNLHNSIGQSAVWSLTDNAPIEEITDQCTDKKKCSELVTAACHARNLATPKAFANAKVTQRINFNYTLQDSSKVKILIYDNSGNFKLSLLETIKKAKGTYQEYYWITDADLPEGNYKVILFINGESMVIEEVKF